MILAICDKETTYFGVSLNDILIGDENCLAEENIPVVQGKKGDGILIAVDGYAAAEDRLLTKLKGMSGEITVDRLIKEVEPLVRECNEYYGAIDEDGTYRTIVVIGTKDGVYALGGAVTKMDFFTTDALKIAKCAYAASEGQSGTARLLYAFRMIERMDQRRLFPVSIYDVRTGKRKIYKK